MAKRRYSKLDKTIHDMYGVGMSKKNIHRSLNDILGRRITKREVQSSINRTHAHWNNKREFSVQTGQSTKIGTRNRATIYRSRLADQTTDKEKALLNRNYAEGKFLKHQNELRELNADEYARFRPLSATEYVRDTGS